MGDDGEGEHQWVYEELLLVGNMSAVKKKYNTAQNIISVLEKLTGGEAMPLSCVNLV
jgi:hypothetical protein